MVCSLTRTVGDAACLSLSRLLTTTGQVDRDGVLEVPALPQGVLGRSEVFGDTREIHRAFQVKDMLAEDSRAAVPVVVGAQQLL